MDFIVKELEKVKKDNPKVNIKEQMFTNSHMFKENLKLICSNCIDMVWKEEITKKKFL